VSCPDLERAHTERAGPALGVDHLELDALARFQGEDVDEIVRVAEDASTATAGRMDPAEPATLIEVNDDADHRQAPRAVRANLVATACSFGVVRRTPQRQEAQVAARVP
jgi:hypothetical protein